MASKGQKIRSRVVQLLDAALTLAQVEEMLKELPYDEVSHVVASSLVDTISSVEKIRQAIIASLA